MQCSSKRMGPTGVQKLWRRWRGTSVDDEIGIGGEEKLPPFLARRQFLNRHIFIHTHVPKTAGSSLSHGLMSLFGATVCLDERLAPHLRARELTRAERDALNYVGGHFKYGKHREFSQCPLYIACVRDPLDRAISYYRYVLSSSKHPNHQEFRDRTFEQSWHHMTGRAAATRSDEQSRIICGIGWNEPVDTEIVTRRVTHDYLLVIPHHKVETTLKRLRRAFNLPGTPNSRVNTSSAPVPDVPTSLAEEIRGQNRYDTAMVAIAERAFSERLEAACEFITEQCSGERPS